MNYGRDGLLIIGYGNVLRADDGAGVRAVQLLRDRGFATVSEHQLAPELAESIAAARTVIFVDADAGVAPGEIAVSEVVPLATNILEHHATPGALLRLSEVVFGVAPRAFFIGLGGERYDYGDSLSAAAERSVEKAVELCMNQDWLRN
jgi:hydrogenase maturation protease